MRLRCEWTDRRTEMRTFCVISSLFSRTPSFMTKCHINVDPIQCKPVKKWQFLLSQMLERTNGRANERTNTGFCMWTSLYFCVVAVMVLQWYYPFHDKQNTDLIFQVYFSSSATASHSSWDTLCYIPSHPFALAFFVCIKHVRIHKSFITYEYILFYDDMDAWHTLHTNACVYVWILYMNPPRSMH